MKIQVTPKQRKITERVSQRLKLSSIGLFAFLAVSYLGNSVMDNMNQYIAYVDAQDELLVEQYPDYNINEEGKIALVQFQAWYGLDDMEELDEEYAAVKSLINFNEEKAKDVLKCPDGTAQPAGYLDEWNGIDKFKCKHIFYDTHGYVEEYLEAEEQQCDSWFVMFKGVILLNNYVLIVVYFLILMYLFVGIAIIADKFMVAIEQITSTTQRHEVWDKTGKKKYFIEEPVWNPTIANLSLMALGSSAPEIFLNVLGTAQAIDQPQDELGPATIVGSAAFNFLFISAVCIPAVKEEEGKKIYDMGVFMTTSFFSIFAYCWLYICLSVWTPEIVTRVEAWITLVFFFILLILAFGADKYKQCQDEKAKGEEQRRQDEIKQQKSGLRTRLRDIAKLYDDQTIIKIAHRTIGDKIEKSLVSEVTGLLKDYFDTEATVDLTAHEIREALEPEAIFERFMARKKAGIVNQKDFLSVKGAIEQTENELAADSKKGPGHPQVRFKCLSYSVAESSGNIDIAIQKVVKGSEFSFGVRTVEDTAKESSEFQPIDKILNFNRTQNELIVSVQIFDNNDWQPDLEFELELYDPSSNELDAFGEYDTRTRVTIIDEDFPGTLGFENTQITVQNNREYIDINVERSDGSDGKISCIVRTLLGTGSMSAGAPPAIENEHYIPINQKVEFLNGETQKTIQIPLINQEHKALSEFLVNAGNFEWMDPNGKNGTISFGEQGHLTTNFGGSYDKGSWQVDTVQEITLKFAKQGDKTLQMVPGATAGQQWQVIRPKKGSEAKLQIINLNQVFEVPDLEDTEDMILKVAIESPQPEGVKISRKNPAIVTITSDFQVEDQKEDAQLLHFFMEEQKPGWGRLFKKAIMLGPQIEEDIEIDTVTLYEAIMHFLTIFWNVLFACVPPHHWRGGWPAFFVALTFIGLITMVVGEVATLLGCVCGIPQAVTGITLVALGTSLPDTFASMIVAKTSPYADSAIGNVTGSNCVNVFLGLGLPWVMASTYMEGRGEVFSTPPGNLAYSVAVFLVCSIIGFIILGVRRIKIGGELGGPRGSALASSFLLVALWVTYIVLSIIKATSSKAEMGDAPGVLPPSGKQ